MADSTPFLPGTSPSKISKSPFERFLPPVPEGMVAQWLQNAAPKGSWVLFPFSSAPACYIEAARQGYRVLVAVNNPILTFLLEMMSVPPSPDDLQATLAHIASLRKDGERFENLIQDMYRTTCQKCQASISAEAFLWEKDAQAPFARVYHCPLCGDSGEYPVTEADILLAQEYALDSRKTKIQYIRALERVAPLNNPNREYVEKALQAYPPRAIYALFNLLNKLDGIDLSHHQRNLFIALLLSAFDQTNALWHYPTRRARPKQLITPTRYSEHNVWTALEKAVEEWNWADRGPVPLTRFPDLPPEQGGICIFEGRLPTLANQIKHNKEINPTAIAIIPRPNQAFWTLSALWSGWVWGSKAVVPFQSVLRRQRYDWAWHATALHATLRYLSSLLKPSTSVFGILPEIEPGLLTAAALAAQGANLQEKNIAVRVKEKTAQITWQIGERSSTDEKQVISEHNLINQILQAVQQVLRARGEPSRFTPLLAAALSTISKSRTFDYEDSAIASKYDGINQIIEKCFSYRHGFLRYEGSPHSLDTGKWWLEGNLDPAPALADQVEVMVAEYLTRHPGASVVEIDTAACAAFPGLLTPEAELVHMCLDSYGIPTSPEGNSWTLRDQDSPSYRAQDLLEIAANLNHLGERLGFNSSPGLPLVWSSPAGEPQAVFHIQTTAALSILINPGPGKNLPILRKTRQFIVLPGSRANLVAYKLQRDPHANLLISEKWQFIKFRLIRQLIENQTLTENALDTLFSLDPLTYSSSQLQLL